MRDREAATDDSTVRPPVRARSVVWSALVGTLVGSCFALALAPPMGARFEARLPWTALPPAPSQWPHAPRAGETARLERAGRHTDLVVTAGSAREARSLARAFAAEHAPDAPMLAAALARSRARWRRPLEGAPLPTRTRGAEVAARLLARARWGRELAAALPIAPVRLEGPELSPPAEVRASWQQVRAAAAALEPEVVTAWLERGNALEARWFADPGAWPGWSVGARAEAWRRWQSEHAAQLETAAEAALSQTTPLQRKLAVRLAREYLVTFDAGSGDPWQAFATNAAHALRPLVRPIAAAWLPPMAAGAGIGGMLSTLFLLLGTLLRPGLPDIRRDCLGDADPSVEGPRLHVVAGSTPGAIMRAALELAARRVALGERVLIVDGAARLRLHERLGRDARWGLLECLAADMPVLGLVQYAGHPGLYLLPHGKAERLVGWSPLGRKLDEVMPHFGRLVLALDAHSPAALGDALRGRAMEGWWAGSDMRAVRAADAAMSRFGIVFHGLDLSAFSEPTLEVLAARVRMLRPPGPPPEVAPIAAPSVTRPRDPAPPPLEPIVLDCDLQVRQRLRFLAWMRRVQAEHRQAEFQGTT